MFRNSVVCVCLICMCCKLCWSNSVSWLLQCTRLKCLNSTGQIQHLRLVLVIWHSADGSNSAEGGAASVAVRSRATGLPRFGSCGRRTSPRGGSCNLKTPLPEDVARALVEYPWDFAFFLVANAKVLSTIVKSTTSVTTGRTVVFEGINGTVVSSKHHPPRIVSLHAHAPPGSSWAPLPFHHSPPPPSNHPATARAKHACFVQSAMT